MSLTTYLSLIIVPCVQDKWTPLHIAAEKGHDGVATLLLDRGANVNAEGSVCVFNLDGNNVSVYCCLVATGS